jgi:exopolysaccharide biosynthesis polyprenyl glycosylphosphotransferase
MTPPESFANSDAIVLPLDPAPMPPGPHSIQAAAPVEEAATRPARHSPTLTSVLDGGGWPWLRVGEDLTALLGALVAAASMEPADVPSLLPLVPLAIMLFWVGGMYRRRISASLVRVTMTVTSSLATSTIALAIWHSYIDRHPIPESVLLRTWTLAVLLVVSGRAALLGVRYLARTLGVVATPTLIVGAGKIGIQIADRLSSRTGYGLSPIGFLDNPDAADQTVRATSVLPLLGSPEELERIVRRTGARHVVISFARGRDQELVPLIRRCNEMRLDISLVPRLFESVNARLVRDSVGPLPLHVIQPTNPRSWEFTCKHIIDRTVAAALLVGLMPLLAAAAAAVKLTSPGPALFRQWRVGRDGRVFKMLKFRSMRVGPQLPWLERGLGLAPGGVEGEDRRTPVGRFLRRASIDELPQLWNVLRGEMSLVGPRPERPEYVEQFRGEVKRYDDRHRVKSGITGAAQVNGLRGKTGLEDRIDWDNYYIENWTLALDLKILAHTVIAVLSPVE